MVRTALSRPRRFGEGPSRYARIVPAMTVVVASLLSALPIVSTSGWFPDFGYLVLISWRLLRAEPWPAWWAAPLGFVNDLLVGNPVGLSIALWSAMMIAMDILDRRTMWRDYWIEWAIAALFIALGELAQWRVATALGAPLPFNTAALPPIIVAILTFPIAAFLAARIDRWRLGR